MSLTGRTQKLSAELFFWAVFYYCNEIPKTMRFFINDDDDDDGSFSSELWSAQVQNTQYELCLTLVKAPQQMALWKDTKERGHTGRQATRAAGDGWICSFIATLLQNKPGSRRTISMLLLDRLLLQMSV